jgi:hypothetical protein
VVCWQGEDVRGAPLTRAEQERLGLLAEYTLDNAHFYCETADITRPFPSAAPVTAPSWEFVWNNWLGASLREEGLGAMCPPLLQVASHPLSLHGRICAPRAISTCYAPSTCMV